jgi:type IV pilus assembly protein PilN
MIRINLLAVREAEETSARRRELLLTGVGAVALTAAVLVVYFSQWMSLSSINADIGRIESELGRIRAQNQELNRMKQQKKDLEEKIKIVRALTLPERRSAPVHILDDLSASTPEYLWLIDFSEIRGTAKINGKAVDNQNIATFANELARSLYFQRVEIRETAQEDPTTTPERARITQGRGIPSTSSIPLKRFLIEANINYMPSARAEDREKDSESDENRSEAKKAETEGGR